MNCYQFSGNDQVWNNWLIYSQLKEPPFVVIKPRYEPLVCRQCGKVDHDAVFREGFEEGIRIRAKGDILRTSEGFCCFNEKVRCIIEANGFSGLTLKPVPETGWYVINITCRVDGDRNAYTFDKRVCSLCGRPREVSGLIDYLSQIRVPEQPGTFFSPVFDRCGSTNRDRDMFVTEDVARLFKEKGIKGGVFRRLLTSEEEAKCRMDIANGKMFRLPRGAVIIL